MKRSRTVALVGIVLLALAHLVGLTVAPPEATMGNTGRLLYLHVPTAWAALAAYTLCFCCSVVALWSGSRRADALSGASLDVGLLLNVLMVVQGMLWARPTWGVWWTTDIRTVSAAGLGVAFAVIAGLRRIVANPESKLVVTGVGTVVAYLDVPVVLVSVGIGRTMHQGYSTPRDVDPTMLGLLGLATVGMMLLGGALVSIRARPSLAEEDAG